MSSSVSHVPLHRSLCPHHTASPDTPWRGTRQGYKYQQLGSAHPVSLFLTCCLEPGSRWFNRSLLETVLHFPFPLTASVRKGPENPVNTININLILVSLMMLTSRKVTSNLVS